MNAKELLIMTGLAFVGAYVFCIVNTQFGPLPGAAPLQKAS